MILYNYFINLVEGVLLSTFIANYFNLQRKKIYIGLISIICFFEISISNYYNVFDVLLIFILILSLFIPLIKVKKSNFFEKIIICSIAGVFLLLANLFSVLITTLLFNISTQDIYSKDFYYIFCTVFSKTSLLCFFSLLCVYKSRFSTTLTLKNGWTVLLLSLTIEYMIVVLLETLLTGNFTTTMAVSLTIALIVICILFLFIFRKLQIDNEDRLQHELDLQRNYFSTQNYTKMKYMSNEIIATEHRMMYVLMGIKKYIDSKDFDKANYMMEQYIKKVKIFSNTINTNNPYFDFVLSSKVNEYMYEDIYLKNTLFIRENSMYDSKTFCDFILYLLDYFKNSLKDKDSLSLGIHEENDFIIVELIGELHSIEIKDELYEKIKYYDADYSLSNIENIYTLKIIIEIQN